MGFRNIHACQFITEAIDIQQGNFFVVMYVARYIRSYISILEMWEHVTSMHVCMHTISYY